MSASGATPWWAGTHRRPPRGTAMRFDVVAEVIAQETATGDIELIHQAPEATRQVWALSVQRPTNDPDHMNHPFKVIWIGDSTLRTHTEDRTCAYCHQLGITQQCPGVGEHAFQYALRFSRRRPDAVEIGTFDVDANLSRMEIIFQIEEMLAHRFAT